MSIHPQNEEEKQKREAVGVIKASRFVRKYAKSHKLIDVETICKIHEQIFKDSWPEIAGKFRIENLKITDSHHVPPHYSKVPELMLKMNFELLEKLKKLDKIEGKLFSTHTTDEANQSSIEETISVVAWLHHAISHIHPFREGNGRTARLAGNLILERYGLVGISIKIEKENKNRYRQSLAQIDQRHDFEPLKNLIYEGLLERYNGVSMKYYDLQK